MDKLFTATMLAVTAITGTVLSSIKINADDYKNDVSLTGEFIRTTLNSEETKEIQGEIITLGLRALRGEDLE